MTPRNRKLGSQELEGNLARDIRGLLASALPGSRYRLRSCFSLSSLSTLFGNLRGVLFTALHDTRQLHVYNLRNTFIRNGIYFQITFSLRLSLHTATSQTSNCGENPVSILPRSCGSLELWTRCVADVPPPALAELVALGPLHCHAWRAPVH